MSYIHALYALLHMLHAHHVAHYQWHAYGYGWYQGHRSANAGVVAQWGTHCAGYQTRGAARGWFGNVWGLRGGDCG